MLFVGGPADGKLIHTKATEFNIPYTLGISARGWRILGHPEMRVARYTRRTFYNNDRTRRVTVMALKDLGGRDVLIALGSGVYGNFLKKVEQV